MKILLKIISYLPSPYTLITGLFFYLLSKESLSSNVLIATVAMVPFFFGLLKHWDLKKSIVQSFWLNVLIRYTFYFYVFDYYFGMLQFWEMGLYILLFGVVLSVLENRFLEMVIAVKLFDSWKAKLLAMSLMFFVRETITYRYLFHDALGYIVPADSIFGSWSFIAGVPLVSVCLMAIAFLIVLILINPKESSSKVFTLSLILLASFGLSRVNNVSASSQKSFKAIGIQTNEVLKNYYASDDKLGAEKSYWKEITKLLDQAPKGSAIYLPELVSPYSLVSSSSLSSSWEKEELQKFVEERDQDLFLGFYYVHDDEKVNAIAKVSPHKNIETVEKRELIPFLETGFLDVFTKETKDSDGFSSGGITFSPSICFESYRNNTLLHNLKTRSHSLIVQFSDESDLKNEYLHQLHRIVTYRAKETGKPIFRITKTGFSGWINANGETMLKIPAGESKIFSVDIPVDEMRTNSLYVEISSFLLSLSFVGYISLLVVLWARRRK